MRTTAQEEEFQKCKESPYYFATKYLKISGQPFKTILSEEEFNKAFKGQVFCHFRRRHSVTLFRNLQVLDLPDFEKRYPDIKLIQ